MEWRKVTNREDQYEVSSSGDIRRLGGKVLCQWTNDQGYKLARLSNPRQTVRVHRIVADAFHENPDSLPFVNHIDCDRGNNSCENLEWCTQWQNLMHSQKLGRMQRDYWNGKRSPNAYLTDLQVMEIKSQYEAGNISWEDLGRKFGVSKRTIGRIVNGESYVQMDEN